MLEITFTSILDVIIKFGGSAVTVKDQLETLKEEELLHACALVNICLDHGKTVVVVHGAG
jgi:isopentenyl phosphate kinase